MRGRVRIESSKFHGTLTTEHLIIHFTEINFYYDVYVVCLSFQFAFQRFQNGIIQKQRSKRKEVKEKKTTTTLDQMRWLKNLKLEINKFIE